MVTVHTNPFSKLLRRRATRWLTRRTIEGVDCVCAVSRDLRRQIEDAEMRPQRIEVTYNPVDTDLFRPAALPREHRRIVFAGRLEEYKGGLRAVQAFASIADRWPGWVLTVAGDGPERPAIDGFLRERPALAARVESIGRYTRPQLAELLACADCFVYPSRHETFGIVLAEAMSAGLPVIAPDRTAPPEFVDESCGILVPPDDVPAIAAALERLLTNLSSYRSDAVRRAVVERFGFDAFGRRLVALYEDLSHSSHPRSCVASPV
jgi:glycosyltransferase involved in cell wall biosynthesis